MAYKGNYRPKNPQKYKGDSTNIVYRSLLERRVMVWLDNEPRVLEWQSELVIIKYISPIDSKLHRYYPDFAVKYVNKNNELKSVILEIKPEKQTKPPKKSNTKSGKATRRYMKEAMTWGINDAKWTYAREWCKQNGYDFEIWTEYTIDKVTGISTRKPKKTR